METTEQIVKRLRYRGVHVQIVQINKTGLMAKVSPPYEFRIHFKGLPTPFTGTKHCETVDGAMKHAFEIVDYYAAWASK